ncbi:MAG: hypothetical protein WC421_09365 [Elusimicrobiales bacterium]
MHPGWQAFRDRNWVHAAVGKDNLLLDGPTAANIALFGKIVDKYAAGKPFVVTPSWPGMYAACELKSPVWEIYAITPASEKVQKAEIGRIRQAAPAFVFVIDYPLDGRDEMRYKNTHPLVEQYVRDNYEPAIGETKNPVFQIYLPKQKALNSG